MTPEQEALFRRLTPAARMTARRVCRRHGHMRDRYDEVYAACLEGLWRAVTTYDPARRANPWTWAYSCCRWAAGDYLRTADGTQRRGRLPTVSLDGLDYEPEPAGSRPHRHDAAELLDQLLEGLHPSQLRLVRAMLDGRQQQQYAAEIGVGPSRVSQLYADVLRHARRRAASLGLIPATN